MAGFFGRLLGAISPFREKRVKELAKDISKRSETELIELGKLFSHAKELAFLLFKKPYSDTLKLTKTVNKDNTKKFLLYFGKVSELSEQLHRTAKNAEKNSAALKSGLESLRIRIEEPRLRTAPAHHNFLGAFNKWVDEREKLEALFGNIIKITSSLIQLSVESAIAGKRFEYGKPDEKLETGLKLERKNLYMLIKQLLMLYRLMPAVVLANKELKMALERIVKLDTGRQKEPMQDYLMVDEARRKLLTACVYAGVSAIIPALKAPFPFNIANLLTQQEAAAAEENTPQITDAEYLNKLLEELGNGVEVPNDLTPEKLRQIINEPKLTLIYWRDEKRKDEYRELGDRFFKDIFFNREGILGPYRFDRFIVAERSIYGKGKMRKINGVLREYGLPSEVETIDRYPTYSNVGFGMEERIRGPPPKEDYYRYYNGMYREGLAKDLAKFEKKRQEISLKK